MPDAVRDPRRWLILIVLCLSTLALVIDNMVLTVAIPPLTRDLGATAQDVQWFLEGYVLSFAGLLLPAGSLSDRYGRRRVMIIGLAVFGVSSLAAAFAVNPAQLVGARALMGAGGALVLPSTLSILVTVFDETERRKAMSAWSAVSMVGMIGGPLLGGALITTFWWGAVFLINVPISLLAIVAAIVLMPESRAPWRKSDPLGTALFVVGMAALLWAINGRPDGGPANPTNLGALVVAALGLGVFLWWQVRVSEPMVPLGLFRDRNFSGASFSLVLVAFASSGLMLVLTQYLQLVLGYSPSESGLVYLPMATASVAASALAGTLSEKISNRALLTAGLLVIAAGFGSLTLASPSNGFVVVTTGLVLIGGGGGLASPAATSALMGAPPPARRGRLGAQQHRATGWRGARGRRTGKSPGQRFHSRDAGLGTGARP